MKTTSELYEKAIQYLNNEISLAELENWLVPRLGEVLALPTGLELDLAGEIELGLSEMSGGHLKEDDFKTELLRLLQAAEVETEPVLSVVRSGQTNTDILELEAAMPTGPAVIRYDILA